MTLVSRTTLQLAMSAALATRSAHALRHLLDGHGSFVFATALASHTSRQMADILSMLSLAQRADVYRRLSFDNRLRLAHAGMGDPAKVTHVHPRRRPMPARTAGRPAGCRESVQAHAARP